jgi:hypothetical protein
VSFAPPCPRKLFVARRLGYGSGAKWSEFRLWGCAKIRSGEAKFVSPVIADLGFRIADSGLRIPDCGLRIADCGLRIADCARSRIAQLLKFAAGEGAQNSPYGFCAPSHRFPMSRSARGGSAAI